MLKYFHLKRFLPSIECSVCVWEEENSRVVYCEGMDRTFIFVGQKNKSRMVKFKLHPGEKHHTANRNPSAQIAC